MYCTIESFTFGENEKNRDIYYSVTFKEYRDIEKRPAKKTTQVMYLWKAGDTWPQVCKKMLGSSKEWKKVSGLLYNRKLVTDTMRRLYKKNKKLPVSKRKSIREEDALINKWVMLKEGQ